MAVYKVAQDVEADDKLLGPFSFRQFVYLIVVAIAIVLAWGLSQLFVPLAILPLPIVVLFGALALPLRKDQPMEVYLAALVSFYLKPNRRLWTPDGIESLVEITVPKTVEVQRMKDISQTEAEKRLSYLANIADTGGWAIRNVADPYNESSMVADVYNSAQQTEDILDDDGNVSRSLNVMINQSDEQRRQDMISKMHQAAAASSQTVAVLPIADPYANLGQPSTQTQPQYNPYPTIRQSVIQPLGASTGSPTNTPATQGSHNSDSSTSEKPISPDIINLASNTDLSIETIQREANRIQEKERSDDDEVFVPLRH